MENVQLFKYCPWISKEIDVKNYFADYNKLLDGVFYPKLHNEEINKDEALRQFFISPDDLEENFSKTGGIHSSLSSKGLPRMKEGISCPPTQNKFLDEKENLQVDQEHQRSDLFNIEKMEEDCSIELLTVPSELLYNDVDDSCPPIGSGRVTNWYAGAYMDGFIPDKAPDKLQTLAFQAKELYKRETVKDYTRLRHRLLKYNSTVRMVVKEDYPEDMPVEGARSSCKREIVFNVRIQRPFHKKCYQRKSLNRFPKHSQEFYMLGSQTLSDLRNSLLCINNSYVHCDMSDRPDISRCSQMTTSEELFPSGFFYINGVFYNDFSHPLSQDNSKILLKWASRYPQIGKMTSKSMTDTTLSDLNIRLGYPYVFQHLGNCEHLIIFTDIRLLTRMDIQDPSCYPLSRGNPIKLSVTCSVCCLYLACWILKDHPNFPSPYTHLCQKCLEVFCYDADGEKVGNFKLFPFIDEFFHLREKENKVREGGPSRLNVHVN